MKIKKLKIYEVEYWRQIGDSYDDFYIKVNAISETHALKLAKRDTPSGAKHFKVIS